MSQLQMSSMELELMTDMFNRMTDLCYQKCVNEKGRDYTQAKGGKLSVMEMTCTDRCVGKYLEASIKIGEKLQALDDSLQQQKAAQANF